MKKIQWAKATVLTVVGLGLTTMFCSTARAYAPQESVIYDPVSDIAKEGQNKGNSVLYPKSAELPNGNLVMTFERSIGEVQRQKLPIYVSTDAGTTWSSKPVSEVASPSTLTKGTPREKEFEKYTSNWTNPFFYVLPQSIGALTKGTLLLASVVSGDDSFYKEQKSADPSWEPTGDGDRKNVAIALYSSFDAKKWRFENIIAKGTWQGGGGVNFSTENRHKHRDPVWEPYLMMYNNQLVCYYSDENNYSKSSDFDETGNIVPNHTQDESQDPSYQVLAHRTWDGINPWSEPIADEIGMKTMITLLEWVVLV